MDSEKFATKSEKLTTFEFNEALYVYSISVYKTQIEKREKIDNKAKFLMSFATVLIGIKVKMKLKWGQVYY